LLGLINSSEEAYKVANMFEKGSRPLPKYLYWLGLDRIKLPTKINITDKQESKYERRLNTTDRRLQQRCDQVSVG